MAFSLDKKTHEVPTADPDPRPRTGCAAHVAAPAAPAAPSHKPENPLTSDVRGRRAFHPHPKGFVKMALRRAGGSRFRSFGFGFAFLIGEMVLILVPLSLVT